MPEEYEGWDTMAVLNRRMEKVERDRQRAAADKALRDTFAAAALTGLLVHANDGIDEETLDTPSDIAYTAYQMADAMLRERSRAVKNDSGGTESAAKCTERDSACCRAGAECPGQDNAPNHDAAPAARAVSDEDRTDKAATSHRRDRPGDTPKPINACVSDRPQPINGPDPDSRVWETHTLATHATRGEGSEPREGTEPVAWGVAGLGGVLATSISRRDAVDMQGDYEFVTEVVPLYRQPQPTLTDAEREAVERGYCSLLGVEDMSAECSRWDAEAAAALRGLLERLGGGK